MSQKEHHNQRLSKFLAYAGIASRRNSEKLITEGRVSVNGMIVLNPATKVSESDTIFYNGCPVKHEFIKSRIWLYHKLVGEICSDSDPFGKRTVFDSFPKSLGKVCLVGRLDYKSEGLLLLTNKGFIKRYLELPRNQVVRTYRVKVWGQNLNDDTIEPIRKGTTVSGIHYAPMTIDILTKGLKTGWLEVSLTEGKNREIRKVLESIGLNVSKLIRIRHGDFFLGKLGRGKIKEVLIPNSLSRSLDRSLEK